MTADDAFLSRWSKRKHQARKGEALPAEAKPEEAKPATSGPSPAVGAPSVQPEAQDPLPPVESLTPESDFTPFMKPDVDRGVRNEALKALFKDPQFNVMDGLDVYIDDYSKPDPLPEGWLEKMTQFARLGAYEPPKEAGEEETGEEGAVAQAEAAAPEQPPAEDLPAPGETDRKNLADSGTG